MQYLPNLFFALALIAGMGFFLMNIKKVERSPKQAVKKVPIELPTRVVKQKPVEEKVEKIRRRFSSSAGDWRERRGGRGGGEFLRRLFLLGRGARRNQGQIRPKEESSRREEENVETNRDTSCCFKIQDHSSFHSQNADCQPESHSRLLFSEVYFNSEASVDSLVDSL